MALDADVVLDVDEVSLLWQTELQAPVGVVGVPVFTEGAHIFAGEFETPNRDLE